MSKFLFQTILICHSRLIEAKGEGVNMEIQEVIKKFNGLLQGILQDDMQDALTVAIKVLEKQIPKTSVFTSMEDGFDEVCPVCGYDVASKYERYCQGCGQAIKR